MKPLSEPGSLPTRDPNSHKGTYGRVLLVAGSRGMIGAAILATRACLRSGVGLVTTACPKSEQRVVAGSVVSAMTLGLPETSFGSLGRDALSPIREMARKCDVVAIGPGLSRHPDTQRLVRDLVPILTTRVILDADAIVSFAENPELLQKCQSRPILTPHPGEMSILLGKKRSEIQGNRERAVQEAARRCQAIVVLKGNQSLISDGETCLQNSTGNPGMATGGSGDVLTGVIAGLLAQGLAPFEATCLSVHVHGAAGDAMALKMGETSLIAEDLIDGLPLAFQALTGPPLPGVN